MLYFGIHVQQNLTFLKLISFYESKSTRKTGEVVPARSSFLTDSALVWGNPVTYFAQEAALAA